MYPHYPPSPHPCSSFADIKQEKHQLCSEPSTLMSPFPFSEEVTSRFAAEKMTLPSPYLGLHIWRSEGQKNPLLPAAAHALPAQLTCGVWDGSEGWRWKCSKNPCSYVPTCPTLRNQFRHKQHKQSLGSYTSAQHRFTAQRLNQPLTQAA